MVYLLDCILHREDYEDKDPGASWDTGEGYRDTAAPLDMQGNVQWVYHKHHTWAPQDSCAWECAGLKLRLKLAC